jgi:hypothetical protein
MKIADFEIINNKKVFKAIIDAPKIGEQYFTIANSTKILPTVLPNNNQYLVLENEEWVLFEKELNDIFYKKDNSELVNTIFQKDIDLYTKIPPLQSFNGTTQKFNNKLQAWEYVEKGEILLEKERLEALEIAKKERLTQLQNDYNTSKKIIIQNGNTLIIEHNTPERSIFLHKLTFMLKEGLLNNVAISYQQNVNNVMYRFSALPTIWNYVFKDLFLVDRRKSDGTLTGFKESSREHNKILFDLLLLQIQNTTTQQELDSISWEFVNPNGTVINVNNKAGQMLNDASVDDFTKSAINQLKDPTTGDIHLIQIIPLFDKNIQTQNNEETPPSRQTSDEEEVGKEFSMS